MNYGPVVIALGLAIATTACGRKAASTASAAIIQGTPESAEAERDATGKMLMARSRHTIINAKSHGTLTAVDVAAGTITLDHGPIPEARWPAGTTTFKAGPAITNSAMVGEEIDFDLRIVGGTAEVTAIQIRP
jgi:Cu(I)/Ag(I) efflux system protein CusF